MDQGSAAASMTGGDAADALLAESALEAPEPVQPALREDQIQNAITFLSHPKVRGSAETTKRAFLEKKGLTSAEIDEAFKRVPPEVAPAAPATSSTPTVGANNLVTYTQQPQQAGQTMHHVPPSPSQPLVPVQSQALVPMQQLQMQPQRPPVHWAQVVLGMGVAAAGVYGLHQLLAPRLSAWSQQLFSSRKAAAEAEVARAEALTHALERLADGQTRLQDTLEGLSTAVRQQQQRQRQAEHNLGYAESGADYLACQSPSLAKRQQQQQYGGYGSSFYGAGPNAPHSVDTYASSSRAGVVRGGGWDPYAPDSSSYRPPSDGRPGSAASPSGRNAGTAAAGGGGPSGFYGSSATGFEVTPPPAGNYRAPQPPAQYQQYGSSSSSRPARDDGGDPGYARRTGAVAGPEASVTNAGPDASASSSRPEEAPRSAAFHEVMAMVQAGITPPNVRTDIDDNPPDPSRPLSAPQMPPRTKPWEGAAAAVSSNGPPGTPGAAYSSNVVPDGPSGFGVRGYGGAAATTAAAMTPTSGRFGTSSNNNIEPVAAAAEGGADAREGPVSSSSSRFDVPADRSAAGVGYDLSQLLGADAARDAPWRPPPPPAATVQRPSAPTSTTLAAADSAPPAAAATEPEQDMQAAGLTPSAASAPAMTAGLDAAAAGAAVPDAAAGDGPAAVGPGSSGDIAAGVEAATAAAGPAVAAAE